MIEAICDQATVAVQPHVGLRTRERIQSKSVSSATASLEKASTGDARNFRRVEALGRQRVSENSSRSSTPSQAAQGATASNKPNKEKENVVYKIDSFKKHRKSQVLIQWEDAEPIRALREDLADSFDAF